MAWQEKTSMHKALHALIVFEEINGEDSLIALLEQELARKQALKRVKETRELQDRIDVFSDVLGFYADPVNYRSATGKLSAVAADKGHKARQAFKAVGNDNGEDEENADG